MFRNRTQSRTYRRPCADLILLPCVAILLSATACRGHSWDSAPERVDFGELGTADRISRAGQGLAYQRRPFPKRAVSGRQYSSSREDPTAGSNPGRVRGRDSTISSSIEEIRSLGPRAFADGTCGGGVGVHHDVPPAEIEALMKTLEIHW